MVLVLISGAAGAVPTTQVTVSHPKTNASVTHPRTAVSVSHPKTAVSVSRPQTASQVSQLKTEVTVSHPKTNVSVSHPSTSAVVTHPQAGASASDDKNASQPAKQASDNNASAQAGQKGSMMSNYQPPQATDFKAAKLGGGEQGLGKTNEAEKEAAAASFNPPKALTFEDAASKVSKSSITEKVKEKTK